jgi:type II secretory pathway component PulJ
MMNCQNNERPQAQRTRKSPPGTGLSGSHGVTLIELLIFMALFGLILGLATAFFRQQAHVSNRTQAGNELAINTRLAAEVMTQDLQVAGSDVIYTGGNHLKIALPCGALTTPKCVVQDNAPSVGNPFLQMRYVTQTRPNEPCRRVSYRLSGMTLERSDVACAAFADDFVPFVDDIDTIAVSWRCSNPDLIGHTTSAVLADPEDVVEDCYALGGSGELISFPRMAIVDIQSIAANPPNVESGIRFSALTPNLRE